MHSTDWGIYVDTTAYCSELSDMNSLRRPMEERYFVKRYKFGRYSPKAPIGGGSYWTGRAVVQCCTLYGNVTHIANTRYRTSLGKIRENLVRSSSVKWSQRFDKLSLYKTSCSGPLSPVPYLVWQCYAYSQYKVQNTYSQNRGEFGPL